jgi:hypothetical protein
MSHRTAAPAVPEPLSTLDVVTSLVVLTTFALAQPMLDLLGSSPEFFLARAAPAQDIVLLGLGLLVAVPAVVVGLAMVARLVGPRTGAAVYGALVVALVAVLVVQVLNLTPLRAAPAWLTAGLAAVAGLGVLAALLASPALRTVARWLAGAPVVFAVLFFLMSPTSRLLAADDLARPAGVEVGRPAPVVVVVLDEFPLASIIDGDGNLLANRYPSLARLAADGIWYRNAVGVLQQTEDALPAMLSGILGDAGIPTASDHPLTLFSLLADTYDIVASESVTDLCPRYACTNADRTVAPFRDRWESLLRDLAVVQAHLALPVPVADRLPSISQNWGDFAGGGGDDFDIIERFHANLDADRRRQVERFLARLEAPSDGPTLYFAHLLFPHIPWDYLPDGRFYPAATPAPGSTRTGWADDGWLVAQARQRHLLQVEYADRIVGRVIDTLERRGIYDEALVVVVADHGAADIPGVEHRRTITPETVGHIAAVPLFVKPPGGGGGVIDDYRAETVDVLPTIADLLEIDLPWEVDGVSLVAVDRPERTESTMTGPGGAVTFGVDGSEVRAVAAERMAWFPDGDPWRLAPPGHVDLIGRPVASLEVVDSAETRAIVDRISRYRDMDLDGEPFPALMTGRVVFPSDASGSEVVAVAIDGVVRGVTRVFDPIDRRASFQVMLPPSGFRSANPTIEVFAVPPGEGPLERAVRY